MKYILFSFVSLFLIGCSAEKSSESKTCTMNGQEVDCEKFNRYQKEPVKISAKVSAAVAFNGSTLDFLENTEKIQYDSKNGNHYQCKAFTIAGESVQYVIEGSKLKLTSESGDVIYSRVSRTNNGLIGQWQLTERNTDGYTVTKLTFTTNRIDVEVECGF